MRPRSADSYKKLTAKWVRVMGYLLEVIGKKKPRLHGTAGIVPVYERHQTQRIESNST
jgi:hypothetical protein